MKESKGDLTRRGRFSFYVAKYYNTIKSCKCRCLTSSAFVMIVVSVTRVDCTERIIARKITSPSIQHGNRSAV